ncbi:type IV secretion system DNA-binding domain-containing protein, partial [Patescibacteria group bacterium]|nr:type IV secretion system DNA-binding domain-containing protein [Patescibacteria group bacterium]
MLQDDNKITYFGLTNSRGKQIPFGIKRKDRARHMYVIGKTGMGKSTLLENMAIQDVRNGEGMAFIDPHGSTAERIMEYVPENRIKDVVYFAPFDMDYPVAFNVMEDVGYDKRHLVVSGLLSAFRKIWGPDSWSARMEYILSNTLLALLEYPGSTLLDVNRMLVNKNFRKKVIENITDPIVKSFWAEEFANYTDRYTQEATPAIQNKIGQFTSNPLIRNIVGQPKSSFDLRKMMDEKKIIIMNLSKGRVGEVNANLLGSMLVTKIYLAAMSRADVPAKTLSELPSFYFYVDEFQSFANQSFADILSEARKYKLNLIIAHQYIEQMEEEVRDAVFGNVGTTIAFRVGPFDAEVLETIFQPKFTQADLVNLGFAQIYLTLMIDGVGSPPFSATTMSPFDPPPEKFVEQTLQSSRTQFGRTRRSVEEALAAWSEPDSMAPKKAATTTTSAPVQKTVSTAPTYTSTKPVS